MGRKTRAEGPATTIVAVRLSAVEVERLTLAARRNGQTVSAFLRDAVAEAEAECLEDHEGRASRDRPR